MRDGGGNAFPASFGRKQWREPEPSGCWCTKRREPVGIGGHLGPGGSPVSPRSPQEYLAPMADAVWVLDGRDGHAGVARHWAAGEGGQLPGGDRHVSPLGQALVDKGLYLYLRPGPVCGGGCARGAAELPVEDGVGLGAAGAGPGVGPPWVAGDDAFGMSPSFRESLAGLGMRYVLDVPGSTPVWPLELAWTSPGSQGCKPRLRDGQPYHQRSGELPDKAWREITVAQGSQGPRSYMFCERVRVTRKGKPGQEAWAVYRRNLDGSEPRYYLSNGRPLETLAYVGGSRWPIETEFETEKGDVGLDTGDP